MSAYAFTYPSRVPSWLMTLLSVNTVLMISMHVFAFMIGTYLKPYLQAASKEYDGAEEGQMSNVPNFSPHSKFANFIKWSHRISHVFGLFDFLLEIILIAWVKFWDVSIKACIASTVIMVPFMIAFVFFYWYFNYNYKTQIYESRVDVIDNVEMLYREMNKDIDAERINHEPPESRRPSRASVQIIRRRRSLDIHL
jgi:hypothetical protein